MIPTDCMTGTNIAKWKFRLASRPGAPSPHFILPPQSFAAIDGPSAIGLRFPALPQPSAPLAVRLAPFQPHPGIPRIRPPRRT